MFVTVTASFPFLLGSTNAEKCPGKMVASGLPRMLMGEVLSVPKTGTEDEDHKQECKEAPHRWQRCISLSVKTHEQRQYLCCSCCSASMAETMHQQRPARRLLRPCVHYPHSRALKHSWLCSRSAWTLVRTVANKRSLSPALPLSLSLSQELL